MSMKYNDGNLSTNPSSIGPQLSDFYYQRKALEDAKKKMYFTQLADTTSMPKHYGKTIKKYHYIPLLDDRNINDQGIDATGVSTANEVTIEITDPSGMTRYAVGRDADAATALTAAQAVAVSIFKNIDVYDTSYANTKADLEAANWIITEGTAVNAGGNLYGSSRDVGVVTGRLPALSENGGRVNRVGFTRVTLEASINDFGFFDEYTRDSVNFDSDAEVREHVARESIEGATRIYEDTLQVDLLNGGNVVFYGGDATSTSTITGEAGGTASVLDYDTLVKVETILNNNNCPKDTTLITGSRMIDTRTIGACRYAYIGSELKSTLLKMVNYHNKEAFIPVQQYAQAGKTAAGEIGAIGNYRFIENPEMLHWAGEGAAVTSNDGYLESNGKYNVYPVLVVGSNSFTTIGFQTGKKGAKFEIIHKKPNRETADRNDPYGKTGFYSIQWWYGTLIQRPEWIACIKVVAER